MSAFTTIICERCGHARTTNDDPKQHPKFYQVSFTLNGESQPGRQVPFFGMRITSSKESAHFCQPCLEKWGWTFDPPAAPPQKSLAEQLEELLDEMVAEAVANYEP